MMAVLDRVPLERITAEARAISFVRTLLTMIAGILFGLGWVIAKTVQGVWFVAAWTFAAVRLGWREARGDT